MGLYYFTDEQVEELKQNPNVKKVTRKSITYQDHFKAEFVRAYEKGQLSKQIFQEAGFDIMVLGNRRIKSSTTRWKKQAQKLSKYFWTITSLSHPFRLNYLYYNTVYLIILFHFYFSLGLDIE